MDKILIIKIGALGDVLRTTAILPALKGEVTWVTQKSSFPLLAQNPFIKKIVDVDEGYLLREEYRLILNLDEEPKALKLAMMLKKKELIGAYMDESSGGAAYTESSASWFDMGLISRLGKKAANVKKWENQRSYQEIIFGMVGKKFNGEEFILPVLPKAHPAPEGQEIVGLETRSGDRWVGKRWSRFPELIELLKAEKIRRVKFKTFPTLEEFIQHINSTDWVVTTDSLALHVALALKKKVVALFTCTSWQEIYGYGRMEKIVSPLLEKYFYNTTKEALKSGEAIEPTRVFEALIRICKQPQTHRAGVPT